MRFVAISDTHCRHRSLKLPKGDVLLHAGDVSSRGQRSEVLDFLDWFGAQPFSHKILIAGNHDFFLEKIAKSKGAGILPDGVTLLNDSEVTIENFRIWGSPVTPGLPTWAFSRQRGPNLRKHWQLVPPETDLLITHGPPYGILDTVLSGRNIGDRDLLNCVTQVAPQVHIFGHIHEAYGHKQTKETRFFNCSQLNESYELVNKPVVFELKISKTVGEELLGGNEQAGS